MRRQSYDLETNRTVLNKLSRLDLDCPCCQPHRGENRKVWKKHGQQKPRYKNKRVGTKQNGDPGAALAIEHELATYSVTLEDATNTVGNDSLGWV